MFYVLLLYLPPPIILSLSSHPFLHTRVQPGLPPPSFISVYNHTPFQCASQAEAVSAGLREELQVAAAQAAALQLEQEQVHVKE